MVGNGLVEESYICKLLEGGSLDTLKESGLRDEMFLTCKDQIQFIQKHEAEYKQLPDKMIFLQKFKDFQMLEVTESMDYLADRIKEQFLYTKLVPIVQEGGNLLREDSLKAYDYLRAALETLQKDNPVSKNREGVDIISSAKDRLSSYLKRCDMKGLMGIPTGLTQLDDITNGWLFGEELVIITGRTNVGKSWIAEFFGTVAWEAGYKILQYSGEMSVEMVGFRFDTLHKHFSNMGLLNGSGILGKKEGSDGAKLLQDDYKNYMGYRNRSGNEIDPTTISRMLSSEKYKGVYVINQRHYDFDTKKTVLNPKSEWVHIPGAVPAIVEPELWDRVQEIKGSKVQSIKNEKRGRNCGKSIFSGKIYCAKCGAKYWRSLENGYVKFKCSSYSKYGKIPGKGCDNKSFSENALYSILQSLSEQIVEVNTAEVRKSLLNWLESLRERLRASQGDDTIKEEIRKQTARKEKLTDAYMDGIISKEDYSKRYKELEKTLEDLKDKLLTLEVNEDLQSIEEVIQNIDKEMEEYLQTQSFNESRVEFLNQHLTKVTVNKDSFLLEFDLIGGAILTGKDFYLFVDNPR